MPAAEREQSSDSAESEPLQAGKKTASGKSHSVGRHHCWRGFKHPYSNPVHSPMSLRSLPPVLTRLVHPLPWPQTRLLKLDQSISPDTVKRTETLPSESCSYCAPSLSAYKPAHLIARFQAESGAFLKLDELESLSLASGPEMQRRSWPVESHDDGNTSLLEAVQARHCQ